MIEVLAKPAPTLPPGAAASLLRDALGRLRQGDRAVSLPASWPGPWGEVAAAFNALARQLQGAPRDHRPGLPAQASLHAEELLVQSQSLAQELQKRQRELQQTNEALQEKARQVAQASRYKSEFLANMSHELRTPLNSLLILSDQLSRNAEGNLSLRQVEFARTIHASGNDLLMLINDILDLSKIESGTVALDVDPMRLSELQRYMERTFRHVAEARGVDFTIETGRRVPVALLTDVKRLHQILKNLLSNAFKFTPRGHVRLTIEAVASGWSADHPALRRARRVIAFVVSDTGIGICEDKQRIIFEAFQQADGSTSRKYGGTGLGLAISRELAKLLGGEIRLASAPGEGSTFTLFLPLNVPPSAARGGAGGAVEDIGGDSPLPPRRALRAAGLRLREARRGAPRGLRNLFRDDRDRLCEGDALMLVAGADPPSVRGLLEVARAQGFKGLATRSGAAALEMASRYPVSAVLLGPQLEDMASQRLLLRLQHHPDTRHLPVALLNTASRPAGPPAAQASLDLFPASPQAVAAVVARLRQRALQRPRRLLLALREATLRHELLAMLRHDLIQPMVVRGTDRLLATVRRERFDAAIIDAAFFAADGERLRQALTQAPGLAGGDALDAFPLVVYTGAVPMAPPTSWGGVALTLSKASCAGELFDQALSGLGHPVRSLPEVCQSVLLSAMAARMPLTGRRVLIVDDDMRNIFALATVLEEHGMDIVWADNGHDAIERMRNDPRIDIVLMDIMMPELDGLATLRELRRLPRGNEVPLVAVTAKAMKGDREKCTAAGAWDYLAKPVKTQDLLAVLRAWLHP